MTDLALRWDSTEFAADVAVEANDLVREDGLRTAVMLSLFLDRRAEAGDVLPDGSEERRGWWGDAVPVVDGDRAGSRLWLLGREKQSPEVLARAEGYAREALQWLLEDRVAEKIDVTARIPRAGWLGLEVAIYRPGASDPTRFHFNHAWTSEEG